MRIVCISDTHSLHAGLVLPQADVLVHAGDLTQNGKLAQLASVGSWLQQQLDHFSHVICIGGNHDFALEAFMKENQEQALQEGFFEDVIYLRDRAVVIDGVKFYGSPWCPQFNDWAFNVPRGPEMKEKWAAIPGDTDVLVTHTPPHGVLDHYWQHMLGDEDLMDRVREIKPRVHVFGHIHNAYGSVERDGTKYFNACSTNIEKDGQGEDCYVLRNAPFVVEI